MLYSLGLIGVSLGAVMLSKIYEKTRLYFACMIFIIPAIFLYFRTEHSPLIEQFYFVFMQLVWLPLVFEDLKYQAVNTLGLIFASLFSILATWLMIDFPPNSFLNALIMVALFGSIHFFYVFFRAQHPFGLGDYPALFVFSMTLESSVLGLWIALSSLMGLAKALGQESKLEGTVPMIPLLYLSWQFCVTLK